MANTPEALVKKRIRKILEGSQSYFAMPIGTGYGNSGVPDFLVCHGGEFLAIEAKAGKGVPTALQYKNLDAILTAGGFRIVRVRNEDVYNNLSGVLELIMKVCRETEAEMKQLDQ